MNQIDADPRSVIKLRNDYCPYCGIGIVGRDSDEDHVIGRRFVPKGKLDGSWNLILRSCRPCNANKGRLEDHISALTMQPDAYGQHAANDPVLVQEAARKGAGSVSPVTKRPVADSAETTRIGGSLGPGVEVSFSLIAPPRTDAEEVYELARLQLAAFFYWITYNEDASRGWFWPGEAAVADVANRSDWGNSVQRSFMELVHDWEPRVLATAADGYFRVAIRRNPTARCWSWALEWNKNLRVIGFFGEDEAMDRAARHLIAPRMRTLHQGKGNLYRFRSEVALDERSDILFSSPL